MERLKNIPKQTWLLLITGFLVGALTLVVIRFATYKTDTVHYHANFALYVNGVRDDFKGPGFYEEVQACGSDEAFNPKARVHMHDQINYVTHVHDKGVTWGHFFANLGYTLGNSVLKTDEGVLVHDQGGDLRFYLNGTEVKDLSNRAIRSEDVLLVNYGNETDEELKTRYDAIPKDAGEYNQKNDPSTCAGSKEATYWERLKQAIGFSN